MPRRKLAGDELLPGKTRSRTGCFTCRNRKIKCDETKPVCNNCRYRDLQCVTGTPLKWETDYASRGLAFGRSGVWSKNGDDASDGIPSVPSHESTEWRPVPHIEPSHFVNSTVRCFEQASAGNEVYQLLLEEGGAPRSTDAEDDSDEPITTARNRLVYSVVPVPVSSLYGSSATSPPLFISPRAFPQLENRSHAPLLNYFLERLCPITRHGNRSGSPFSSIMLPFSVTASPMVLNSILAYAACHASKPTPSWKPVAMQLEGSVLRDLGKHLAVKRPQQVALDFEIIATLMMLCMYEMTNHANERWTIHLQAAQKVMRMQRRLPVAVKASLASNPLMAFSERFFDYQTTIIQGASHGSGGPIFGNNFWDTNGVETDAWLGCSPDLVGILYSITGLIHHRRTDPRAAAKPSFRSKVAEIDAKLAGIVTEVENDELMSISTSIKRLSAAIYLHAGALDATPSSPLIASLVHRLLHQVSVLIRKDFTTGIIWPLFMAAVELDPKRHQTMAVREVEHPVESRAFVLQALQKVARPKALVASRTQTVIEKVWAARTSDRPPVYNGTALQHGNLNDWDRFVAPFSGS